MKVWVPLLSAFATMALLYSIGNVFHLSLLRFSFVWNTSLEKGLFFDVNAAILPFVIGLIVGFVVEHILKSKTTRT